MSNNAPVESQSAERAKLRLRHRRDFIRAAKSGATQSRRAFKLQCAARAPDDIAPSRFGFTVTKKIANAVGRNRIRRRLKEALRLSQGLPALPGHDYVFVARGAALTTPFSELQSQIADAFAKFDAGVDAAKRRNPRNRLSAS
jgi:ribonuclease P protein component